MRCLVVAGVACIDGQEIISKAKVPIIKFVDRVTGLRVDISFENMSGVTAVSTFKEWTTQYHAMPILVTLIKQFLLMRDLNEVYSGGLGGFSTTCLVVSMLQQMPAPLSDNLGELLLSFLELYGTKFNMLENGISLNPPGYFTKVKSLFE
jgi:non-canonical poly(A) RNA polymerase PAPD5/7